MYGPLNSPPQPSPLLLATPSRFPNYHLYKFKTPFPRYVCSGPQRLNVQQKDLIFVFKDNNYSNGLLYPSHPLIPPLLPPQTAASCSRYVFQCGGGGGGGGQRQLQLRALCGLQTQQHTTDGGQVGIRYVPSSDLEPETGCPVFYRNFPQSSQTNVRMIFWNRPRLFLPHLPHIFN